MRLLDTMRIDGLSISELLGSGAPVASDKDSVREVLQKAELAKGLSLAESALLLQVKEPGLLSEIHETAARVKQQLFGSRVVLFAPLYLSNHCNNGCLYCGFRASNRSLARKSLSTDEVVKEANALVEMGFKRLLMVTGEEPNVWFSSTIKAVEAVYRETGIRIIHVNAPTMEVEQFKELKSAGVGVYQAFQETYHKETYAAMHPTGPKSDYGYRLGAMDRAMEAGFGDVGIGPLLGLYDFRFEVLASIAHSTHLFKRFGTHAHTISVPRLRPAEGSGLLKVPNPVSDEEMKLTVAVLRLAVPTTGVVVSTRESAELRTALLHTGASQLSAGSRTDPGGYGQQDQDKGGAKKTLEQFSTDDHRPLADVMASIAEEGFVPSLCTTCYRTGRTGSHFFSATITGDMERRCRANAILSLKEYMVETTKSVDSSGIEIKALFESAIAGSLGEIEDEKLKEGVREKLKEIEKGRRDLFY